MNTDPTSRPSRSADSAHGVIQSSLGLPGGLRRRWLRWCVLWSDLLDSGLKWDRTDSNLLRRIRKINAAMLTLAMLSVPMVATYWWLRSPELAAGAAATGAFGIFNMILLRRTRDPVLCGHLAAAVLFVLFLYNNLNSGGFYDSSFGWFYLLPLVGGVLMDVRASWLWTSLVAFTAMAFWLWAYWGLHSASHMPKDLQYQWLLNRLAILAGLGVLITLFVRGQRTAEAEIRNLAFNDPLTELPNRQSFRDSLEEALDAAKSSGRCLALLFIDLDRFKEYNDTLGDAAGDEVLRRVGVALHTHVRASDLVARPGEGQVAVSRFGGDEFTVVLSDVDSKEGAAKAARRLLDYLAIPMVAGGVEVFVSASIGVALYPDDGEDVEMLLRRADTAMYNAKQRGGNTFEFFTPWMSEASLRRVFLENRLRRATVRDEMLVVYQPIFEARSGRIVAVEALLRWNSPSMGAVSPVEFIPVAEETGLITEIGDWVLQVALQQLARRRRESLRRIRLSVNYWARQPRQEDSIDRLCEMLKEAGIERELLELEITERVILREDDPTMEDLKQLRSRGIGIALDDFGTGYSSLSYLRRLPLDDLKVDRSFVSAVASDPQEANLTSAIVAMAKSLGIGVVAEGVESEEQMEYLRILGCDELRGYHLSRPLPPDELAELLREDIDFTTEGRRWRPA